MSIYSGFSTRNQESIYGKLCEELVTVLANRVMKVLKGQTVDEAGFVRSLVLICAKMEKLELHKYLPPKLSLCCDKLVRYCSKTFVLAGSGIGIGIEGKSFLALSPLKIDYEMLDRDRDRDKDKDEQVKKWNKRPAKSTTHTREKDFFIDGIASLGSKFGRYSRNMGRNTERNTGRNTGRNTERNTERSIERNTERKNRVIKIHDRRGGTGECVQLNDGMFYRLV